MKDPLVHEESSLDQWQRKFASLSSQLNAARTIQEPLFASRVPIIGPLIASFRRLWNGISTKWYVRSILEQQNRFNAQVVHTLDELASMLVALGDQVTRATGQAKDLRCNLTKLGQQVTRIQSQGAGQAGLLHSSENAVTSQGRGFGFIGITEEDLLEEADDEALQRWEDADVPILGQHSHAAEVRADEKEPEDRMLSFPLHWWSWGESWRYLYNLALIGDALYCPPGDLVLEFAAGPCWVSEFLNRLGIRTVSVDLSTEMLRRGRRRLHCDQRLNPSAAQFIAGDGLRLPFADESFDGVICTNSLHHMSSYRQALAEILRVLKQGGRAAFSEPGAGHASNPMSQTRMREQGVLEKSVSLPLVHRLARRVGFDQMEVIPLLSPPYYLFEYTASLADYDTLYRMWEQTLQTSPLASACFVLQKGARPLDTRMPPHVLWNHRLRAEITLVQVCERPQVGEEFTDILAVHNTGDVVWLAQEQPFVGQVTVGVKILTENGRVLQDNLVRTCLPHDVVPGEKVEVKIRIPGLRTPGRYVLKYDLVVERIFWFEECGSLAAQRLLEVVTP